MAVQEVKCRFVRLLYKNNRLVDTQPVGEPFIAMEGSWDDLGENLFKQLLLHTHRKNHFLHFYTASDDPDCTYDVVIDKVDIVEHILYGSK